MVPKKTFVPNWYLVELVVLSPVQPVVPALLLLAPVKIEWQFKVLLEFAILSSLELQCRRASVTSPSQYCMVPATITNQFKYNHIKIMVGAQQML